MRIVAILCLSFLPSGPLGGCASDDECSGFGATHCDQDNGGDGDGDGDGDSAREGAGLPQPDSPSEPMLQGPDIHCAGQGDSFCVCIQDENHGFAPEASADCDRDALPNGYCCADPAYPDTGDCECQSFGCLTPEVSGPNQQAACGCGLYRDGDESACEPGFPVCCLGSSNSCTCSPIAFECPAGDVQVANCEVSELRCPDDMVAVDSCEP